MSYCRRPGVATTGMYTGIVTELTVALVEVKGSPTLDRHASRKQFQR